MKVEYILLYSRRTDSGSVYSFVLFATTTTTAMTMATATATATAAIAATTLAAAAAVTADNTV